MVEFVLVLLCSYSFLLSKFVGTELHIYDRYIVYVGNAIIVHSINMFVTNMKQLIFVFMMFYFDIWLLSYISS